MASALRNITDSLAAFTTDRTVSSIKLERAQTALAELKVAVQFRYQAGWHILSSKEMAGLYVDDLDMETAWNGVDLAIENKLLSQEGMQVVATPDQPFSSFLDQYKKQLIAVI